MADVITPTEEAILRALGQFHYCTSKHLMRLGVSRHPGPVQSALKTLRERTPMLVRALDFGLLPGVGRLPILYGLTERGADLLLEAGIEENHAQWIKSDHLFANDYVHRCQCVDLHISIADWLASVDGTLDTFVTYYTRGRKEGSALQQATTVIAGPNKLSPDIVFKFTMPDGKSRLCAVEQHNGDDAKRLIRQVAIYASPGVWQAIEDAYDYSHGVRLLLIFEKEKTLEKFQKLAEKEADIVKSAHRVFLKTHERTVKEYYSGWEKILYSFKNNLF